jgi:hypothetical protein
MNETPSVGCQSQCGHHRVLLFASAWAHIDATDCLLAPFDLQVLLRIHTSVRLTEREERFLRRAVEDADFEMHDAFVTSSLCAADYLGETFEKRSLRAARDC